MRHGSPPPYAAIAGGSGAAGGSAAGSSSTLGPLMDFAAFCTFCAAWEQRHAPAAVRYFFQILDLEGKGHLAPVGWEVWDGNGRVELSCVPVQPTCPALHALEGEMLQHFPGNCGSNWNAPC